MIIELLDHRHAKLVIVARLSDMAQKMCHLYTWVNRHCHQPEEVGQYHVMQNVCWASIYLAIEISCESSTSTSPPYLFCWVYQHKSCLFQPFSTLIPADPLNLHLLFVGNECRVETSLCKCLNRAATTISLPRSPEKMQTVRNNS